MHTHRFRRLALLPIAALFVGNAFADNPFITDQFTADPTARLFEGKIYVYPSHDIPAAAGRGRSGWFVMEDYHVFSSSDLMAWQDHGVIVHQNDVPWVNPSYAMWAPDCVFRNGKYYFYFPAPARAGVPGGRGFGGGAATLGGPATATGPGLASAPSTATGPATTGRRGRAGGGGGGGGNRIGVAIADKPGGPFKPEPLPIQGIGGIDPCVLIDKDGQAYLYVSQGRISVAKLKENMVELDSPPQVIDNLPTQGLIEGPFVFERNGLYYLTYPHAVRTAGFESEQLEYAIGKSPTGPFTVTGVIMDQNRCWTNHHSLVEYQGQWILFYHQNALSPDFDKNRAICADYLSFNEDGTIKTVVPTLRGVGIAGAKNKVQIDRYSEVSKDGTAVSYLNNDNKFAGWKVALTEKNAWVRYNRVDFGAGGLKSVKVQSLSSTGGTVEIRLDKADGPVLAKIDIAKGADWKAAAAALSNTPAGVHDLIVSLTDTNNVEVDWVTFE